MNKIILIGNISYINDLKPISIVRDDQTQNIPMLSLGVITNDGRNINGEWQDEPNLHALIAWNITAINIHKHFKTGDKIGIEGKYISNQWVDQKTGKKENKS